MRNILYIVYNSIAFRHSQCLHMINSPGNSRNSPKFNSFESFVDRKGTPMGPTGGIPEESCEFQSLSRTWHQKQGRSFATVVMLVCLQNACRLTEIP